MNKERDQFGEAALWFYYTLFGLLVASMALAPVVLFFRMIFG